MRRDLALMVAILLLAFAIGAAILNADPVWLDELASLTLFGVFDPYFNPSDVLLAMSRYSPADVPIFPIMGAWWARLVGISQFALRAMPLLLGMLSLAMAYRFARDVFNRRTGFVAAFLLASNSFALIYFHELRNYTHFMVMSTLYVWVYLRLTDRARERWRLRLCFPLLSVLFIYTHAYGGILIAALALHHVFLKPKDRRWLEVWLSWALAAIAMLPFALAMVEGVALVTNDGYADPLPEVFGALLRLLVNGADWLWLIVLPLVAYAWRRTRNQNLRLVIALAAAAIALLLLGAFAIRPHHHHAHPPLLVRVVFADVRAGLCLDFTAALEADHRPVLCFVALGWGAIWRHARFGKPLCRLASPSGSACRHCKIMSRGCAAKSRRRISCSDSISSTMSTFCGMCIAPAACWTTTLTRNWASTDYSCMAASGSTGWIVMCGM